MATPIKMVRGKDSREVTSPAEQVRLEYDGWTVEKKKASADNAGGGTHK